MSAFKIAAISRFVDGRPVPDWGIRNMRLPNELIECIVYLYPDLPAAELGDCTNAATGFWVDIQTTTGHVAFLVTNAHVIEQNVTVARWNKSDGKPQYLDLSKNDWIIHSDKDVDIAVHRMNGTSIDGGGLLPTALFLNKESIAQLDVRLDDDICMLGMHRNYNGVLTNQPTARFGHLVQFPGEKIRDDRGRLQSVFLGQIPSLPGFSGSPVFLIQDETEKNAEHGRLSLGQSGGRRIVLLGVNCGHLPAYSPTYRTDSNARNDHLNAEINSGIIYVSPAWNILDAINSSLSAARPSYNLNLGAAYGFGRT